MADRINNHSPEFLFGQILTRLSTIEECQKEATRVLQQLPCGYNTERIGTLEKWKEKILQNGTARSFLATENRMRLKTGLIIAFSSSSIGAGMGAGFALLVQKVG